MTKTQAIKLANDLADRNLGQDYWVIRRGEGYLVTKGEQPDSVYGVRNSLKIRLGPPKSSPNC